MSQPWNHDMALVLDFLVKDIILGIFIFIYIVIIVLCRIR